MSFLRDGSKSKKSKIHRKFSSKMARILPKILPLTISGITRSHQLKFFFRTQSQLAGIPVK